MGEESTSAGSLVKSIRVWIETALDESYARFESHLEGAADASLKISDAFKEAFPGLKIIEDLWISDDYVAWEIKVREADGIEHALKGDRAKDLGIVCI